MAVVSRGAAARALLSAEPSLRERSRFPISVVLNAVMHRFIAQSCSALLRLKSKGWLQIATPFNVSGTMDPYIFTGGAAWYKT
ncbi:MAG: hypothetical protein ACTXOO_00255 [Sodalis sp. (in: enterobacteria)]